MKYKIYIFSFFILFSSYIYTSYAQEETAIPIEVNGDEVEYFPEEKKIVGRGNISIDYENVKLRCSKITVDMDTKDVYAEGNVRLLMPTGTLEGEEVRYNFETRKGEILKAKMKSGEWYGRGERIDIISEAEYSLRNGYITSCNLDSPHYKISSKNIVVYPDDNKVIAKNVIFKIGNIPVAFLPRYNYSMKSDWPTFDIIPGKKKKWGIFALTSYRYRVDENNRFTLRIDERENWGIAEGIDYKYNLDKFGAGIFRTYFTHQRDRDRNEPIKGEEERYRVQLRHRWDINEDITSILEYHKLSDREVTKDFFYREEYEREPSPESYLYLLDRQPEYGLSFLARKRLNRFESVTERLPEVRFDMKDYRLTDTPIYFKTDTSLTNLNSKTADSSEDSHVFRLDNYNKVSVPFHLLDFLSMTPFAGMRDTFYSRSLNNDENQFRTVFYTGMDMSTKFFKTYDISGRFLGIDIDKVRHIITPSIKYKYIHEPSTTPAKFQQFDDIDKIDRKNSFSIGLENKLQTKRIRGSKVRKVDMIWFLLTGDYLYKDKGGSRFSNVKGDLEFTPLDWLRIESDVQYLPDTRDFQNWDIDLYIARDEWRLGFGSRYWQDTEDELTSELFYKLNDRWSFRFFGRYDLKEVEDDGHKIINRFESKEVTLIKDLHCWTSELSWDVDRDGGTTVWFVMRLKASPKVPFDFNDYYVVPKKR